MNINTLTQYVNLAIDDSFTVQEITKWFNQGIANYNLIPPLTLYPFVQFGTTGDLSNTVVTLRTYSDQTEYPLDETFMLGVMLPYISSSIRSSESALSERQLFLQEYLMNAMAYKRSLDIPLEWMRNKLNNNLSQYEIGERIFISDFTKSPFAGEWQTPSTFSEMVIPDEEE
jgi:hypothetical protein